MVTLTQPLTVVTLAGLLTPLRMCQIPPHRVFDTGVEVLTGLPAKLIRDARWIYGVTTIMAGSVRHVSNPCVHGSSPGSRHCGNRIDHRLHDLQVRLFSAGTDVVRCSGQAIAGDTPQCVHMIIHIQPVANLLPISINRNFLLCKSPQNRQRNQFLRKLVRPEIIRRAEYNRRNSVGSKIGTAQVVRRSF